MTKDSLIQIIKDCEEGKVSADAVLTAVETYSSASNNGKPIVSGSLPEIPDWIIKYDKAGHQSSAGKAIRFLMDRITVLERGRQ